MADDPQILPLLFTMTEENKAKNKTKQNALIPVPDVSQ